MHIRAYRDSDLPLLCQIFLRAVRETASRDYTPGQIAAWAQVDETRWRQKLADSIGLVAVVNSQPVGFITAIGTHIDLLFVSPDRARQGIGGALIEALCVQYPAQILTVDASITAKPCFTAHGFKVVAEQRVAARGERDGSLRREWDTHENLQNTVIEHLFVEHLYDSTLHGQCRDPLEHMFHFARNRLILDVSSGRPPMHICVHPDAKERP